MRLLTYLSDRGPRLAALVNDRILDIGDASGGRLPAEMVDFIAAGPGALPEATQLLASARPSQPLSETRLLAPLQPRRNVFCVARNYLDHLKEGARARGEERAIPQFPIFFTKPPSSVIGPDGVIPIDDAVSPQMDYEVELAVVVGRAGKNVRQENALQHVFGYTVANDVSARDLQRSHGIFKGKSLDGTCPLGPWIVTADELGDPHALHLKLWVNGELRQDASTADMLIKIPVILHELSRGMELQPGDVLSTGTPSGIGLAMTPPRFLRPGDVIEAEIDGIGLLRNRVVAAV